jgi:hypothetical protein
MFSRIERESGYFPRLQAGLEKNKMPVQLPRKMALVFLFLLQIPVLAVTVNWNETYQQIDGFGYCFLGGHIKNPVLLRK